MRYKLQVTWKIELHTSWHVGSGLGGGILDRTFQRDHENKPMLPASLLKGVVRENCEKMAATLGFSLIRDAHSPERNRTRARGDYIIDRLFGNSFEGEKIFFRNALLDTIDPHISIVNRNSIDRLTSTSAYNHLYNTEQVDAVTFVNNISAYHNQEDIVIAPNDDLEPLTIEGVDWPLEYSILLCGILLTEKIGSSKSRGLGHLSSHITEIKLNQNDIFPHLSKIFESLLAIEFILSPENPREISNEVDLIRTNKTK